MTQPSDTADVVEPPLRSEVVAEREAILKMIEETAKLWSDGDAHQLAEVLLARIRARSS